jgi:hypothetical protein
MRLFSVLLASLGFIATVLLLAVTPGCGKSPLAKAYVPYNAGVERLLDEEMATWKRFAPLFTGQFQDENPDYDAYAKYLTEVAVPFYDGLVMKVAALPRGDAGLDDAHAALVKFAASRAEFAHLLAKSLDAVKRSGTTQNLNEKDAVAEAAKTDYTRTLQGPAPTPDVRFNDLMALSQDFAHSCVEPLSQGKATAKDAEEAIRTRILPKVRKLRGTKFDEDESSRKLRDAIAAAESFYVAVVDDLPRMEARSRLSRQADALAVAGKDAFDKFQTEMKAVRGKL